MTTKTEENVGSDTVVIPAEEPKFPVMPKMWSIGGGKGGTGKSFITLSLGIWLAKMGKKVTIIDADLGGANMHILFGIRSPAHTLNDFLVKKVDTLQQLCMETTIPGLTLISGGDDILSLANPKFAQKERILRNFNKLDADYILLDLGAGTSFNVLDFFVYTPDKIVVVTPFPTSVQNAYGFIKSALYRRLSRIFARSDQVLSLIERLISPSGEEGIHSIMELVSAVERFDPASASLIMQEVNNYRIKLIVNMVRSPGDARVGEIIKIVSDKYLGVHVDVLRPVPFDVLVDKSIQLANPYLFNSANSEVTASIYEIVSDMIKN
jgi:flagellar biosynthesis protein FlhG